MLVESTSPKQIAQNIREFADEVERGNFIAVAARDAKYTELYGEFARFE